jgi:uncharacterized membrane protein
MHYQQLIITEPVANFRTLARRGLQDRWGDAFWKGLLYILLLSGPLTVILGQAGWFDMFGGGQNWLAESYTSTNYEFGGGVGDVPFVRPESLYGFLGVAYLYEFLVSGALTLGVTIVYLRYRRRQEAPTSLLFAGFSNYGRAFLLALLMGIFVLLWSLLFIIPGIIAAYRYKLAFYILADNPGIGPLEAISLSKGLMAGNKWKAFCLDLSFIGWAILAAIAQSVVSAPLTFMLAMGATGSMVAYAIASTVVSGVTMGILYMYMGTASAAFYERASGLLRYIDETPQGPPPGGTPYRP